MHIIIMFGVVNKERTDARQRDSETDVYFISDSFIIYYA